MIDSGLLWPGAATSLSTRTMQVFVTTSGTFQRKDVDPFGTFPTTCHFLPPSVETSTRTASPEASLSACQVTRCELPAAQDSPPLGDVRVSVGSGTALAQ